MPLELLMTRGSDQMSCRGPGLCSIGEAVAELMAGYEVALEGEAGEPEGVRETEPAFAMCV
jgi:hypothetical protein